ncbi:DUF305 domain-containing protein [Herbaspirillum sp. C7C2]|uniref:DUF305 domain-containing protein n=1 Tax=Herbaspirillum sp. C7C2 TaxID=2736666 RepID=UPI00237B84A6|nr:DUF305 domain-containing protein [Herbaspirillum sp. C7C2]
MKAVSTTHGRSARGWRLMLAASLACSLAAFAATAPAHDMGAMHGMAHDSPAPLTTATPPVFVASSAKPFSALNDDAMAVMDYGMQHAPMNGQPDHDFVSMMLPHHQGAVDMARAVLLYSQDPEIRNLALGIVAEQQNEIQVMQAWLKRHGYPSSAP